MNLGAGAAEEEEEEEEEGLFKTDAVNEEDSPNADDGGGGVVYGRSDQPKTHSRGQLFTLSTGRNALPLRSDSQAPGARWPLYWTLLPNKLSRGPIRRKSHL